MSREPAVEQGRIREYLLRNLADAERARFEESYFADDALLDRVEAEEDLLVSDYVLGRLTDADRRRFEKALLGDPVLPGTRGDHDPPPPPDRPRPGRPRLGRGGAGRLRAAASSRAGPGIVVAFALLGVLLLASLVTALRLKEQLAALRAELNAAAPPAVTAGAGGVVPATPAVVLQAPAGEGIAARRVERAPGSPLVLVFPRPSRRPTRRRWRVVLRAELRRGPVGQRRPAGRRRAPPPTSRSGSPPGVPEAGRVGVTLWADGAPALSALLEIVEPPPARRVRFRPRPTLPGEG